MARARRDVMDSGGAGTPRAVLPLLHFTKLPTRAVRSIVDALDEDETFRERVAEGLVEDEPDRPSWLFLTRPDGWEEELALYGDFAREQQEESSLASRLRSAERQLQATRHALEQARSDLADSESRIAVLESQLSDARSELAPLRAELAGVNRSIDDLRAERARTVGSLKSMEDLATERLSRIRELESLLDEAENIPVETARTDRGPNDEQQELTEATRADGRGVIDTEALAHAFADAAAAIRELSDAFDRATEAVGGGSIRDVAKHGSVGAASSRDPGGGDVGDPGRVVGSGPVTERSGTNTSPLTRGRRRRTPLRLQRGAVEGSPEGINQILRTPGVVVFVDGYNVAMEGWPTQSKASQRDSLVQLAGDMAARTGAEFHLVFDGVGDGSRPNVGVALPVRVHFSDVDTEADDLILDLVAGDPISPTLVISSDKRVRTGARRLGANVVTSSQILRFCRSDAL